MSSPVAKKFKEDIGNETSTSDGNSSILELEKEMIFKEVLGEMKSLRLEMKGIQEKQEIFEKTVLDELKTMKESLEGKGLPNRFEDALMKLEAKIHQKIIDMQPKEPKNWNDLPNELKVKVIENCDFKTRIHVGMTCRLEKELVERAKPIVWKCLGITIQKGQILLRTYTDRFKWDQKFDVNSDDSLRNLINALIFVLKLEAKAFEVIYQCEAESIFPNWFTDELRKHGPFDFRKFAVFTNHTFSTRFFKLLSVIFENRGPPLETCSCWSNKRNSDYEDIYNFIDKIYMISCRFLRLGVSLNTSDNFEKVITHVLKHWIDKDAPIGTRFSMHTRCSFSSFELDAILNNAKSSLNVKNSQFLIRREKDEVRTMNGKPKTILIRTDENEIYQCVNIEVIPTELRPSEYEKPDNWTWMWFYSEWE